jgi:peptidoglycan/LPS O-acetylase OafA/YrhL
MGQSKSRNGLIDILRGVSILLVLIHHFDIAYRLDRGIFANVLSAKFVHAVARNGNYGVIIFFTISGFLITSNSLSRFGPLKNVSLRAFYALRFARIAPNLALILGIVVPLAIAGVPFFANKPGTASLPVTVLSILTFTHNVLMRRVGWFNYPLNILWSLSVEEMFYFTFPLVCVLLRKNKLIVGLWVLVALAAPVHRFYYRNDEMVAMYGYLSCFDGIAIGCMAAVLKPRLRWSRGTIWAPRYIAAAVIVFVYLEAPIMSHIVLGVSVVALASGVILLGSGEERASGRIHDNAISRILQWFGRTSYELYVFHIVVLAFMRIVLTAATIGYYGKPAWFALYLCASGLLAGGISRYYSEPLNRSLRRFLTKPERVREPEAEMAATV